jgi:4-amino-4-deoxy-L-arabinose transferase-like glycosyltransferase
VIAFTVRFHDLTTLPNGMHGDEAVAGLEAQRILDSGGIGPYSPPAAGQPAGPLYLFAVAVWAFGHSLFAVRLIPALVGSLTVPLLYAVVRRSLGVPTALMGAFFLAVMGWHIHFARVGFPLETWPFVVLLAVGALVEAVRSGSLKWWALAGALTSSGVYVYNGHVLMLGVAGVFLLGFLIVHRGAPLMGDLSGIVMFASAGFVVALPMVSYAADSSNGYFEHFDRDTVTTTKEWKALNTPVDKLSFITGRYRDFWDRLSFDPELDGVDATGLTPIVPVLMLGLAAAGVAAALALRRTALVGMGVLTLALMPFGSALTVDGVARRSFAMAPFVAMFCAIAIVEGVRGAAALGRRYQRAKPFAFAGAGVAALLTAVIAFQNIHDYFWTFRDAPLQEWVYVTEFTGSINYISHHSDGTFVYYLSERWSFNYEPRLFVAGSARGEDRSREFAKYRLDVDPTKGRPLFVLVGNYKQILPELQRLYPGGDVATGGDAANPAFIAYTLPER